MPKDTQLVNGGARNYPGSLAPGSVSAHSRGLQERRTLSGTFPIRHELPFKKIKLRFLKSDLKVENIQERCPGMLTQHIIICPTKSQFHIEVLTHLCTHALSLPLLGGILQGDRIETMG